MNTAAGTTTYAKIVVGAAFQVGDRVRYVQKAFNIDLFGTVLDVRDCGYEWSHGRYSYRIGFDDPVRSAPLEGTWRTGRYLERMGDLEQLAFSTGL